MLNPGTVLQSIEMLHIVPRILMGLLAVLDTFLLFKITERRYSLAVALISSVLFAVMPFTWVFRRVYLDTILVPFLLSSILFAVYMKKPHDELKKPNGQTSHKLISMSLILLSGIFSGLAIYTKAPAITMMPLVGSLVFLYSGKKLTSLGIWLLPVILIPLLWPLYSVVAGQTDLWIYWVLWQTDRNKPLSISLTNFLQIDPVIVILGTLAWLGWVKKDFFPLIWVVPFLVFSYFIGWVQYFHLVPIFPAFCIGSAIVLKDLGKFIARYSNKLVGLVPFAGITIFGLVVTTILVTSNVNAPYFKIYSAIAENLNTAKKTSSEGVTIAGSDWWVWDSYWITQYVLGLPHEVIDPHFDPFFKQPIKTKSILFVDDPKVPRLSFAQVKEQKSRRVERIT